ncbi:MAG: carbohydrate kinase [Gammaproteobacteria bacterium]|nr:MAG: carbohydrate kinase [Gammaproteobacteria bacterium]
MADPGPLFLGIDVGTSGVRACLLDQAGRRRGFSAVPLPPGRRSGTHSEQDPQAWWAALLAAVDGLAARQPLAAVAALALDATAATLLATDARGRPLGPALMYDDRRAGDAAERVLAVAPGDPRDPAAAALGPSAGLAKWLWLRAHHPGARILHQADWLIGRLLGGRFGITDAHTALKTGYDPVRRTWPDWVRALAGTGLPRVHAPGTPLGRLAPDLARRWKMTGPPWVAAGTTDSTAAVLATGVQAAGEAVTVLGSTLVLKVASPRPIFFAPGGVYSHRLPDGLWLAGGASNSGGRVLAQHFSPEEIERLGRRIDPRRPLCLEYYPLPGPGERFPVADPELPPRLTPRPRDEARFLQGLLEGMARIERLGYRRLAALGAPAPTRVVSLGGGARNDVWRAIRQRRLGVPVTLAREQEAACGAARLARLAWREVQR